MKAFYSSLSKWLVLVLASASFAGCSIASVSSKPGTYSLNGYTTAPEAMAATLSDNYVNETNAEAYRDCVREGRCYAYPGGGYGNDYQYYFGNVIPPTGPGPMSVQPEGSSGNVTQEQLKKVEEKADDSLRMHKKLQKKLHLDQPQQ
jgi:hypothetical protein